MMIKIPSKNLLAKSILAANLALAGSAIAIAAEDSPQAKKGVLEEVTVTSYRKSLERARELKRNMVHQSDSIVAEDIGKMPDLNLAESLQRVPGVAITREGGEGRNITVRGLGPGFTRTTLNGMEVPASTGGLDSSGGVNRGRDFDFNVFGAELFNRITINKSGVAHIEEGGLASTVELYSRKPFDVPGRSISLSAQGSYNMDSEELDPRVTALYSQTFNDEKFGILASITHSERTVHQEGFGTVRWTSPFDNGGRSWAGTDADVIINGTPNPAANYPNATIDPNQQLDYMWHPRLPRMDSFNREQDRTGYTLSLQFRPQDNMLFGFDVVGSQLKADVESYNYFAQYRNLQQNITPVEVTIDPSGRLITGGTFTGVQPRSESRGQFSETDFLQTVFSGEIDLTENITLKGMYGRATSEHKEEQYRFNITASQGQQFNYSFADDGDIAEMSYGFDILDPSEYVWSGPTFRLDEVERENDTFKLDLEARGDNSVVRTGIIWNSRTIDSKQGNPVGITSSSNLPAVSASNTRRLSQVVDNYGDIIDAPGGFPVDWLVSDFNASINAYNAGTFVIDPADSNTFDIEEETLGGYVEAEVETTLLGRPFTFNAGVRVVNTEVSSNGVTSDGMGGFIATNFQQDYTEYLPSTNLVWEFYEDVILRMSMGRNLTRPGLGSLAGSVDVTPINGNVSVGNPDLEPIRADSIDVGVEWYFAEESLLSVTFFRKQIESFITGQTIENQPLPGNIQAIVAGLPQYNPNSPLYDPSLLSPGSSDWNITTSINGEGADLDGYEIGYQHALDFLLPGVGVFANFTHVESEAVFGNGVIGSLEGLSENSYNAGVYYENDTFGARIVLNDRDDYVTDQTGDNGNASHATTGPTRIDMSFFYNISEDVKATLEVINLTNEEERLYTTGPLGNQDLVREINATGTEVLFGIRANF
ncbi:TonB-dependent receptor [Pseudomaricurvus alcaniphilus]|uniref:TonB-dependent receptor n=1 Tax=Pseudomaricurvus alcaniphilus TaxID=1166482 RepID=UPI00140DEDFD|nr:TonB-dependent receptor [Pseudomaricurvus alcaniphilus]NHN36795.1 TonB-dependent receptor [Pseudomaricurvus alcaniphilus]